MSPSDRDQAGENPFRAPLSEIDAEPKGLFSDEDPPAFERKASSVGFFLARFWVSFSTLGTVAYVTLLLIDPLAWAVVTGVIVVAASGLFTTKIILKIEQPRQILMLSPIFGVLWLLFFWLLYKLQGWQ